MNPTEYNLRNMVVGDVSELNGECLLCEINEKRNNIRWVLCNILNDHNMPPEEINKCVDRIMTIIEGQDGNSKG